LGQIIPNLAEFFFLNSENNDFSYLNVEGQPYPPMGFLTAKMSSSVWINLIPVPSFIFFCFFVKFLFFFWKNMGIRGKYWKFLRNWNFHLSDFIFFSILQYVSLI
jgi:hypothetical protein